MCTSLTGALTTTGVSTSSTPRAAKNSRVHARSAARRSRSAREALGRQSPPPLMPASREPGERLAHLHAAAGGERAQPLAPALRQQQYDRGAHVEAAELGAFLELERRAALIERQLGAMAQAPRRHLAVPHGLDAADEEGSHQHQGEGERFLPEDAHHALVAREESGNGGGGGGIDAEQPPRHVPRRAQPPGERHVDAVVVERRKVERRERARPEVLRPGEIRRQERLERIGTPLGLHQPRAVEPPDLTHAAVDRRDERAPIGIDRARARDEPPGEEGVEARVAQRVRELRVAHVGVEAVVEGADERLPDERCAYAGDCAHHAREEVLRQQVLQRDEEPRPYAVGQAARADVRRRAHSQGAARRRSAASGLASKGGVNTATTRALASSRNTTAEWSMVESPPGSSTRLPATPKSAAIGAIDRAAPVSPRNAGSKACT